VRQHPTIGCPAVFGRWRCLEGEIFGGVAVRARSTRAIRA